MSKNHSNQSDHSVEDDHIDSAEPKPSPLEAVQQHQKELQQAMQQTSEDVQERRPDATTEVPGQGPPSTIRYHPQRNQYGAE